MRAYAIRDASIDKNRDLAWLLYYEREDTFHIEISEDVDEWEAPLILSSFVKRGMRALDPYWSRVWVEQRIVPRDRQNLGMILKANDLKDYDAHLLLVLADGKCAQDECFIAPIRAASFPAELSRRLAGTLSCMLPVSDRTLFFFRDGLVESITSAALQELSLWENEEFCAVDSDRERLKKRLRLYREGLAGLSMQAGGHGITIADDGYIPVSVLRSSGTPLPVAAADFKAYLQQELIDTAEAARIMGCTRQNIQDLVRRGRISPVKTLRNNFLFLRSEIAGISDPLRHVLQYAADLSELPGRQGEKWFLP